MEKTTILALQDKFPIVFPGLFDRNLPRGDGNSYRAVSEVRSARQTLYARFLAGFSHRETGEKFKTVTVFADRVYPGIDMVKISG